MSTHEYKRTHSQFIACFFFCFNGFCFLFLFTLFVYREGELRSLRPTTTPRDGCPRVRISFPVPTCNDQRFPLRNMPMEIFRYKCSTVQRQHKPKCKCSIIQPLLYLKTAHIPFIGFPKTDPKKVPLLVQMQCNGHAETTIIIIKGNEWDCANIRNLVIKS